MKVFAFDLGSGSIGECVREDDKIKHLDSLIIDNEFASTKEQTKVKRGFRMRVSHKMREEWWIACAKNAGLEILSTDQPELLSNQTPKPDGRMLKEFSSPGDSVIYNSALLRIALLNGLKLESWQVFKAVWSAIQHRGYDANIPWDRDIRRIKEKLAEKLPLTPKEEELRKSYQEEIESSSKYTMELNKLFPNQPQYHYPCYLEAYKMGIWSADAPLNFQKPLSICAPSARNKGDDKKNMLIAPRQIVVGEIRNLLRMAAKQYPSLAGKEDFILFGPAQKPYASVADPKTYGHYRGRDWDLQGVLGQKIPRFDNRIISKCRLMPRYNVCKADEQLNKEVTFLLTLKNMRFTYDGKTSAQLLPEQLSQLFEDYKDRLDKTTADIITKTDWRKELKNIGGIVNENQPSVPRPKMGGRSSFCRPALILLKELILSGKAPLDFYNEKSVNLSNTDRLKGIVKEDLSFLLNMPKSWEGISIQDTRAEDLSLAKSDPQEALNILLSNISNPVVRHRLYMLSKRLKYLSSKHGTPDKVFLEVIREDFLSERSKRELIAKQNKNRKEIETALKDSGAKDALKMRLFRQQGGLDLYDLSEERKLNPSDFAYYEIDHIVPRSRGGSDSIINKVLTKNALNSDKANRTPYEWLAADPVKWTKYLGNIKESQKTHLPSKKVELLISDEAIKIEQNRNDLQATAYLEKLAQKVVAITFGWGLNTKGDTRKVFTVSGGQTAQIRKNLGLDRLLHTEEKFKEYLKSGQLIEKNRTNKKHHALDALVISIAQDIKYDPQTKKDIPPAFFTPPFCAEAIATVYPREIKTVKPALRETIYGLKERTENGKKHYYIVTRFNSSVEQFRKLADAKKNVRNIFDVKIKKDLSAFLDNQDITQEDWDKFFTEYTGNFNRIKKITKIESGPFTQDDIEIVKGRRQIDTFYELGKMKGQFLTNKESHKGQILFKDLKGKWRVDPVYLWESLPQKLAESKKKYNRTVFFKSGQLVEIKEIRNSSKHIKAGVYKLRTINKAGQSKIESISNQEIYTPMIGSLLEEGQMKPFNG